MKTKDKAVIFLAIFGLFTCLTDGAQPTRIRRVLVLNSYHPTYEWTKLIVDGIEATLQQYSDRIEMDIEYMDTRHFEEDETHYGKLYALYKHKTRQKRYDVIITSDDDAFSFVLQHRTELYPNVPVVFCGVGRLKDSMLEGQSDITGVIEERSVGSTVEIALKFHPSARQVVFVKNGRGIQLGLLDGELEETIQRFEGRAEFVQSYLYEFNAAELLKIIGGLGDESIVVFTSSFKDVEGNLYGFEDEAAMLSEQCLAPIYVISKEWLGIGPVLGGKVSSASHQGQTAAEMAIRILDGENARNIPIVRDSPYRYMFDYIQMKRFGILPKDLPEGSVIINEPKSFYYLYKRRIWAVTATIAALTAVVIILSVNILRRMAAEKKLREEREKAQKYLDVAGTIMVVIEPGQKVTLINKKGCEILGYNEGEILGRKWFDNFTPQRVCEQMGASFQQAMAGEKELVKHNERPVLTKSGQERIIAWHNAVLTDEYGNIVSLLASGVDITERKQAEEKLRESETRFRTLVEHLPAAVYTAALDESSTTLYVSPQIEEMLGISPEEYRSPDFWVEHLHNEDRERVLQEVGRSHESGEPLVSEYRMVSTDGRTVWFRDEAVIVKDGKGDPLYLQGVMLDITERKRAEEKLLDYQGQLKSLASELSLTEERERRRIAIELHDRISQFLVISKVKLETLCESASGELAKAISEVCNSLDQTIRDTRSLTSDLSSPILYELGFEAAVAEWLAEQIQQRHGITTEFEDDGQPKPLDDDICALLFRNVRELLVNVVKHAQAHKVKVSIWRVNSQVHLSVEDDGVGFNPAKVASAAARTGGFGLFSIRERLEQVGGQLQIESAPGCGTKITVAAPLKNEDVSSEVRE